MRADMSKVIVERPRWGSRWIGPGEGRRYRASEDVSSKQGMQQGYKLRKSLSETLNPLRRYIASQVNRPWDKVYSEICANIDRRNTVQDHIFTHMHDTLELHARLVEGEVRVRSGSQWVPLEESHKELYVHPRTGILLRNRYWKSWAARRREARATWTAEVAARRRMLNQDQQLHYIDGHWYLVTLEALPPGVRREIVDGGETRTHIEFERRWDAVRRKNVSSAEGTARDADSAFHWYGRHRVYAAAKRQLSERELRQHGLKQKGREVSRPFCSGRGFSTPAARGRARSPPGSPG